MGSVFEVVKVFFLFTHFPLFRRLVLERRIVARSHESGMSSEAFSSSNAKELRSFVCLASYFRMFIPHFADVAEPLQSLLRKNARWEWTDVCDEAFSILKFLLTSRELRNLTRGKGFILVYAHYGETLYVPDVLGRIFQPLVIPVASWQPSRNSRLWSRRIR
jgi:hypothetical protein